LPEADAAAAEPRSLEELLAELDPDMRALLLNLPPLQEQEEPLDWLTLAWGGPYPLCDCDGSCMFCETVTESANAYLDGLQGAPFSLIGRA
jgi:hypothetical protein